jgi:hypothetical protein
MIYGVWYGAKYGIIAGAAFLLMRTGEYIAGGAPESLSINAFLFLVGLGVALLLLSPPLAFRQGARGGLFRGYRKRASGGERVRLRGQSYGRVINMGPSGAIVVKLH